MCRRGADAVLAEFSRGFRGVQRVPRGYSGVPRVCWVLAGGLRCERVRVQRACAFAHVLICVVLLIRVRSCARVHACARLSVRFL